jgi:dihydropteroate synthase
MHIKGKPKDMQTKPVYVDLLVEIKEYFQNSINLALEHNVNHRKK